MTTIDKIFEFDAADIERAAVETDTTIMELLAEVKPFMKTKDADYRAMRVYNWLKIQSESMLEMLEDEAINNNECPVCHGASTPELQCYHCGGSLKAANDAAEAEYNADMKADEEWLRRHEA